MFCVNYLILAYVKVNMFVAFFLLKYLFLISQIEDMPTSSPEMFGAPPLPSTIKEALHQRLDKAGGRKGFILVRNRNFLFNVHVLKSWMFSGGLKASPELKSSCKGFLFEQT